MYVRTQYHCFVKSGSLNPNGIGPQMCNATWNTNQTYYTNIYVENVGRSSEALQATTPGRYICFCYFPRARTIEWHEMEASNGKDIAWKVVYNATSIEDMKRAQKTYENMELCRSSVVEAQRSSILHECTLGWAAVATKNSYKRAKVRN